MVKSDAPTLSYQRKRKAKTRRMSTSQSNNGPPSTRRKTVPHALRHQRDHSTKDSGSTKDPSPNPTDPGSYADVDGNNDEMSKDEPPTMPRLQTSRAATIQQWAEDVRNKTVLNLRQEYAHKIKRAPSEKQPSLAFKANAKANRYKDVKCADASRVKLAPFRSATTDYIHANFVTGLRCRFIASQGPTSATITEHWRMIWQENVPLVLMLCNTVETGSLKCSAYWPRIKGTSMNHGGLVITCTDVKQTTIGKDWVVETVMNIKPDGDGEEAHHLTHVQWTNWPDKSVPSSSDTVLHLATMLSLYPGRTVLVHCSAGIGRTGSLIALQVALETFQMRQRVRLDAIVKKIRSQRLQSVQTEVQYIFVHRAFCTQLLVRAKALNSQPVVVESMTRFRSLCDVLLKEKTKGNPPLLPIPTSPPTGASDMTTVEADEMHSEDHHEEEDSNPLDAEPEVIRDNLRTKRVR